MADYNFHYLPLEGKISGLDFQRQTEDAINDLGNSIKTIEVDVSDIEEAVELSQNAVNIANNAESIAEDALDTAGFAVTSAASYASDALASANNAQTVATALTDIYNEAIAQGTVVAPAVDATLSISGAAADAKATGDRLLPTTAPMVNLFDKNNILSLDAYIGSGDSVTITSNANAKLVYIPCKPNTTYTVSKTLSARFCVGYTTTTPTVGGTAYNAIAHADYTAITITTSASAQYIVAFVYLSTADTKTYSEICNSLQIEEGATATAYHPFQYTAIDLYARELTLGLGLFGDLNVLSANDDLDNISNGVWVAQTTAIANTILNKPVNVTTFKIISFQLNGTAQVQIVIGQNDQLYYRTQKGDGTYNDWRNASDLLQFLSLSSYTKITTYGTDIAPALSSMTGTGTATFDTDKWVFSEGGSIYADISVTKDETYLVSLTIDSIVVTNGDINVSPATISIGTESIDIFSAADANWNVVLTAQTSGTVRFTFSTLSAWAGNVTGLSIKPIANRATKPLEINSLPVNCYNSNVSLGGQNNILYGGSGANAGGRQNAAYGWNCQRDINTGKWNSAFGYNTQLKLTQGIGNSAFGTWAQNALTTGCYNNAFGESAQNHMVDGMWNDAHGIEAQGMATTAKNNVAMGRRSQHLLTTGNFNTAVGAWSGFNSHDVSPEGKNAVKTSNYTTLVGGASTLLSADAGDSDYATALGYQTKVAKQGLALGALSTADENGIAIGHNVSASTDEIVIGNSDQTVTIAGKTIVFNNDGSVSWS